MPASPREITLHVDVRFDEDESRFLAVVREMPGCWGGGVTADEALQEALVVAQDYLITFQGVHVLSAPTLLSTELIEDDEHVSHSEIRVLAGC